MSTRTETDVGNEDVISGSGQSCPKLTDAQKAHVERNRQRALLLRQARLTSRPYVVDKSEIQKQKKTVPVQEIDTGAGFFLEEEEIQEESNKKVSHPKGAVIAVDNLLCNSCEREFMDSYLYAHFDVPICDNCRDNAEENFLITKTDSKNKYLLKDADFDKREPPLKYVVRKNPHNQRWGEMKLYYEPKVYERAMEVWGSEEKIEEAREKRQENRDKLKQNKFDKKIKALRLSVRSSLARKDTGPHVHEFGEETYNEEEDMYSQKCKTCSHVKKYEKM